MAISLLLTWGCTTIESAVTSHSLDTGGFTQDIGGGDADILYVQKETNDSNSNNDSEPIHNVDSVQDVTHYQDQNADSVEENALIDDSETIQLVAEGSPLPNNARILFLHHSTGGIIWEGGVQAWIRNYNNINGTNYSVETRLYPSDRYCRGWNNYPYDYWQIWVNHAGTTRYCGQETLEMLTPYYDLIIWKHCNQISNIYPDSSEAGIEETVHRPTPLRLQYNALRSYIRRFPGTRFLLWTSPPRLANTTQASNARRGQDFVNWVRTTWDQPHDNIFLWDLYQLGTRGGLYFRPEYAVNSSDNHPNDTFARQIAPFLGQRIVDVIEGRGDRSSLTGQ